MSFQSMNNSNGKLHLNVKVDNLQQELSEVETKYDTLSKEHAELMEKTKELTRENRELTSHNKELDGKVAQLTKKVEEFSRGGTTSQGDNLEEVVYLKSLLDEAKEGKYGLQEERNLSLT